MSTLTNMQKAIGLVASLPIKNPSVSCDRYEIRILVEPLELAILFNVLVQKSKLETTRTERYLHISFRARGARWTALIAIEESQAIFDKLGANTVAKLTAKRLALPAPEAAK
jgi:hypothetical protein